MRKLMLGLAPLLVVAALAISASAASALTTYGTCVAEKGHAKEVPCKVEEKFVPFTEERTAVIDKKVSTNFVLEAKSGAAAITCTAFKSAGFMWNAGGFGKSDEKLVFEKCTGSGELAGCTPNGNGIIEGAVADEVLAGGLKVKIKTEFGFGVVCGEVSLGNVEGTAEGSQASESAVLKFSKAEGLTFDGKASTITGEDETETVESKKKVLI